MSTPKRLFPWIFWPTAIVVVFGATYWMWRAEQQRRRPPAPVNGEVAKNDKPPPVDDDDPAPIQETLVVKVLHPRRGAMERVTTLLASVQARETVELYSKVTGYLKSQSVDIGSVVKKNKVLAVVEAPELEVLVERNTAVVEQTRARVLQVKAKVAIANSDVEAAKAHIVQAEANAKSAAAFVKYRALRYQQMKDLAKSNSVEGVLVDEAKERYESAVEAANAAVAAIATAKAQLVSTTAKIALAEADVVEAESQVRVAQADLKKAKVELSYADIVAPFDGIVTYRSLDPRGFVRSAGAGGTQLPLLTIQRTDIMRVVARVPDRDVPYADTGDSAIVEIDALPGEKFNLKISRIAKAADPHTRQMPVEIDLPNPSGKIQQGMFGRVTITLDRETEQLSVPSTCLAGKAGVGKGIVYIVRAGKAHRTTVTLGRDSGVRVEVLQGLDTGDAVVLAPPSALADGAEVEAVPCDEPIARADNRE